MYEHLAKLHGGPPNQFHYALYSKWAEYNWGMVITGNVQVSSTHLTLGRDLVLPKVVSDDTLKPFSRLLSSIRGGSSPNATLAIMQLNHTGRQSTNFIGGRLPFQPPLGPSPIRVQPSNGGRLSDLLHVIAFQTPYAMSTAEIDDVVEGFVKGAMIALESGFDGVQLHAAHGCK
jgi:2,4-dienoyl-CoA reductase-like NADH-dependent reductase (Old Yellow Enzyme family)